MIGLAISAGRALVGSIGVRDVVAAGAGLAVGLVAMRLAAGLWIIPAAERVARAEVRAEFAAAAAEHVAGAVKDAREIERSTGNATDLDLRCALRPDACGVH